MSDKATRQKLLLGGLGLVLVAVMWFQLGGGAAPTSRTSATAPASRADRQRAPETVHVGLERLSATRPAPADMARNPFRFGAPPPAPVAPPVARPSGGSTPGAGPVTALPTGPPPPPPIPFKFIGLLTPSPGDKVAVLSDGRTIVHGREGDVIEGRYRLLTVADEAVQMEYLDGRGRRTIRLTGA